LEKSKNIKFLKEANSDINHIISLFSLVRSQNLDLKILSGNDDLIPIFSILDSVGVVSVLSNLYPNQIKETNNICLNSNIQKNFNQSVDLFYKLLPTIKECFETTNPIGIKDMLFKQNLISNNQLRLPLVRKS
jgi:4-hydroxy-tetrahydrodipicolinate synthase